MYLTDGQEEKKAQFLCREDNLGLFYHPSLSNPGWENFMVDYLKLINCIMDQDRLLENYELVSDRLGSYWIVFVFCFLIQFQK